MLNCCKQCTTEFIASLGYNFKRDFSTHKYTPDNSSIYDIVMNSKKLCHINFIYSDY